MRFVNASCVDSLGLFVNISVYILTKIPIRLSNSFYTNNFVDVENAMHNDLVTCNNLINYKVLLAFDFDFLCLEPFQLHDT